MPEVRALHASELGRWRAEGRPYALLDVRTAGEVRLAPMPGAIHVPMHEVPRRAGEIPRDVPLVVLCHSGVRSQAIAELLARAGFEDVYNLEDGIDAYSQHVDPSIPRY